MVLICLFLLSCSKDNSTTNFHRPTVEHLETEINGSYHALLAPINKTVSGHLNGALGVVKENKELFISVRFSNGPRSVLHNQNIHIGNRCPSEVDDLNADEYIDAEEGSKIYKEIIIPLDDDISSQRMGGGTYPISDEFGYYIWSRSASMEKVIEDLLQEDIHLTDDFAKIRKNQSLTLIGKVIVITGIPETSSLPATVRGRGRLTPHQALPVACGIIRRLTQTPGIIDTDSTGIAIPDGETVGGSSGADDGAIFNTDDPSTGDYGEDEELPTNETEHAYNL